MAHWTKSFKRYERHFLLALVILLLASFSVTGALQRCGGEQGKAAMRLGGSFQVSPTKRSEVSDADAQERMRTLDQFVRLRNNADTIAYEEYTPRRPRGGGRQDLAKQMWRHVMLADAAREAGFRCGPAQLRSAIEGVVSRAPRQGSMRTTDEGYDLFLTQVYQGPAATFEATLAEIVAKDELLSVLVDPARFDRTYAEAFELWKTSRERVDLRTLAVEASSFTPEVRLEEETRRTLSAQEDALKKVWQAAGSLNSIQAKLQDHKNAQKTWPESLAALTAKEAVSLPWALAESALTDPWGQALVYTHDADKAAVTSNGPDLKPGTDDDVTLATYQQIEAHRRLAKVAKALPVWHKAADPQVWPETLDLLLQVPPRKPPEPGKTLEPLLAPLAGTLEKDPWGEAFVYVPDPTGKPPALSSKGPDAQPGTPDDIVATIDAENGRVAPGPAFAPLLQSGLKDAWERALHVRVRGADLSGFEVVSDGKDGLPGTLDDLDGGNRGEIERFWSESSVKQDVRLPVRREWQALLLHVQLVSDERLKRLWNDERFVDLRPSAADEETYFNIWNKDHGPRSTYEAADPRDPEHGFGAAFAKKRGWPKEAVVLVPDKAVFAVAPPAPPGAAPAPAPAPVPPDPAPAPAPGPDGAKPPEAPKPADAPKPPDPNRKEYEEKGWREVLLRQEFLERVLNKFWQEVVKSHQDLRAWEDAGVRVTPPPAVVELGALLGEDRLGKYQPTEEERQRGERFLVLVDSRGLMPVKDMDQHPEVGDPDFSTRPQVSSTRGREPSSIPVPLNHRLTKALYMNLALEPERTPTLDEPGVGEKVFERFVEKRCYDRAERELKAFQADVEKRSADRTKDPAETPGWSAADETTWTAARDAWKQAHPGVVVHDERTGWFIGSEPPNRRPKAAPADASPEAKAEVARRLRRAFVCDTGYDQVRAGESGQDTTTAKPLTFGRKLPRDDGRGEQATGCVYLVRVAAQAHPSKSEFSPKAYAEVLRRRVFGNLSPDARKFATGDRPGALNQALAPFLEDLDRMRPMFDLRTNSNLDQLSFR